MLSSVCGGWGGEGLLGGGKRQCGGCFEEKEEQEEQDQDQEEQEDKEGISYLL